MLGSPRPGRFRTALATAAAADRRRAPIRWRDRSSRVPLRWRGPRLEPVDSPLEIEEYQPIVEVVSHTWQGSYGKFPNIKFMITDGCTEMLMRVSYRRTECPILFFSKKGPFNSRFLNVGRKIKLIDYTTELEHGKGGDTCPTVHIEKLRAEPRKVQGKSK